jgi:formylglycine-generating enzyme required for sulfatase activity
MPRLLTAILFSGVCGLAQAPKVLKNATGIEFVKISPGEFMMGCSMGDNDCANDEKPSHRVHITKPFEIGKYEVTQVQWQAVMGSNPSTIKGDDHPVETVSRDEVHNFIAKLNEKSDGYRYRLPSEAEWEFTARAGTDSSPKSLEEVAWYAANSDDESHPVGKKKPNAWGLYDMLGNVREWVEDNFTRDFYSNGPAEDPLNALRTNGNPQEGFGGAGGRGKGGQKGGGMRQLPLMRGGGWDNPASFVRVSARYHYYGSTLRVSDVGFRVAREPM